MKKISIIIPVYNEKKTVLAILEKIELIDFAVDKQIILIDDGSTDGSVNILKQLSGKYTVVLQEKNAGKGAAIHAGLRAARGDYVIIQDADLEYDPEDYKVLFEKVLNGDEVVYGSRNLMLNSRSTNKYYWGGRLITFVTNLLYGSSLTDVNTCYKLFPTELLRSLELEQERFSFCEEATVKLLRKDYPIIEVPIHYYPRLFDEGKKIRARDGIIAIRTLLKYKFL